MAHLPVLDPCTGCVTSILHAAAHNIIKIQDQWIVFVALSIYYYRIIIIVFLIVIFVTLVFNGIFIIHLLPYAAHGLSHSYKHMHTARLPS